MYKFTFVNSVGNTNDSTTTSSGAPEISAGSSTPPVKPSAGNVSISVVNTTDAMTSTANQRLGKSTWPSNQTIATDSFEEKATLPNKAVGMTYEFNLFDVEVDLLKIAATLVYNMK